MSEGTVKEPVFDAYEPTNANNWYDWARAELEKMKADNARMSASLELCSGFLHAHGWEWPEHLLDPASVKRMDAMAQDGYLKGVETLNGELELPPPYGKVYDITKHDDEEVYRHVPEDGRIISEMIKPPDATLALFGDYIQGKVASWPNL